MTDCAILALGFVAVFIALPVLMALATELQRWLNLRRRERLK